MHTKRIIAALLAATGLRAHANTYTDLWNNANEPGWGMNVVQQLETAFVTLFVYGDDGKPTWLVASDARIVAYSNPGGFPVFSGALYRTQGPVPGVQVQPVGRIDIEVLAKDRMRVTYGVDGRETVREVRRYSFQQPMELANYTAQFVLRQSRGGQPYGTLLVQADMLLHLDSEAGQLFARADDQLGRRCEYRGPYAVSGKLVSASGTFTCTSGDATSGTFELTDLELNDNGFTGRLRTASQDHAQLGKVAGVRW